MTPATQQQPEPRPGGESVTLSLLSYLDFRARTKALLEDDLMARRDLGIERYGTELTTENGRDPLVDAYQEALDLALYLRQAAITGPSAPVDLFSLTDRAVEIAVWLKELIERERP